MISWSDIVFRILGALLVYCVGYIFLTKIIHPNKLWWAIFTVGFVAIFAYTASWLELEVSRTVSLMSVKWGSFGLALLAFRNARGIQKDHR
jgi:magnesium-transporting ATPase (P-type)